MTTLIYFADPMCSWCWGFGPVIERAVDEYDELDFELVVGGLRPDADQPIQESYVEEILHHWEQVEEMAGQPFDRGFFEKHPGFVYDTMPGCRGVKASQRIEESAALDYEHALARRFYAEAEDPTDLETLTAAAEEVGLDPEKFREIYRDGRTEELTRADFERARKAGVQGYPTVHVKSPAGQKVVSVGYQDWERFSENLERKLS